MYTGHRFGPAGINGVDRGVRELAAHHAHPQLAGGLDVVDELVFASEKLGVFLAQHTRAEAAFCWLNSGRHDAPSAALCTAFTML